MDRAVERQAKRTRSTTLEGENQQNTQGKTTGQTDEGKPAQGSGGRSSSSGAMGANQPEKLEERDRTDKKRKAYEESPEDPERSDGKWIRSAGPTSQAEDEDEESRLKKIIVFEETGQSRGERGDRTSLVNEEEPDEEEAGELQAEEGKNSFCK